MKVYRIASIKSSFVLEIDGIDGESQGENVKYKEVGCNDNIYDAIRGTTLLISTSSSAIPH